MGALRFRMAWGKVRHSGREVVYPSLVDRGDLTVDWLDLRRRGGGPAAVNLAAQLTAVMWLAYRVPGRT